MAQHIVVKDYNPEWNMLYQAEEKSVKEILGANCSAIYHIGSTSVEGLAAKPIIDIMPVVKDLQEVDCKRKLFEEAGYEYLGEFGMEGRRYLRKGGDERTHQIHIFEEDNSFQIERHLAVRDFLRTHKEEANKYGELKQELALRYPYDIDGYCEGKEKFVSELEQKALIWKKTR